MIRFLKIAVPVFVLGFIAGNAFWYLASPLWIDREVSEALAGQETLAEIASGEFRDADSVHRGSGKASVFLRPDGSAVLRLTEFQVTNGPDLEVWLVAEPNPEKSADVKNSTWLALGQLLGVCGYQGGAAIAQARDIGDVQVRPAAEGYGTGQQHTAFGSARHGGGVERRM